MSGTEVMGSGVPTLENQAVLPFERWVEVAVQSAAFLEALHARGQVFGSVTAQHVVLTEPVQLRRAPNSQVAPGHRAVDDVQSLAQTLATRAGLSESGAAPLLAAQTAGELKGLLERMRRQAGSTKITVLTDAISMEPDLTGQTLGMWEIQRFIAEGAMGRVYLAKHQRIGRVAAVKVLKREHAVRADLVQRFIQEAQAVNAIRNEHIVEVYDFGEEQLPTGELRVYCIMELLQGHSLADALAREKFTVPRAARVARQISLALQAAHSVGVVHRDIKPDNIFLTTRDGADYVKVLDFGIAKFLKPVGELPTSGTQAGTIIGTPEYMAPEQALGQETSERSDIYAVGLVLYEMLAGQPPYRAQSFGQLVVDITSKPLPALPASSPGGDAIPPQLVSVLKKATAREAVDRYQSAGELAQALEVFGSRESLQSLPAVADLDDVSAIAPALWPRVLMGLVALAALGAGLAWVFRSPAAEPASQIAVAAVEKPVEPVARPQPVVEPPAPPQRVSLQVDSQPSGAEVTRADSHEVLGTTPFVVSLPPQAKVGLDAALAGYQPSHIDVPLEKDAVVKLDLQPVLKVVTPAKPVQTRPSPEKKPKQVSSDKNRTSNPFDE